MDFTKIIDVEKLTVWATSQGMSWVGGRVREIGATTEVTPTPTPLSTPILDRYKLSAGSPDAPPAEGVRGCRACAPGNDLASAVGHMNTILELSDPELGVPSKVQNHPRLTALDIQSAYSHLDLVERETPVLKPQCDATRAALDEASAALPKPGEVTIGNARDAAIRLDIAHAEAAKLALDYYSLEDNPDPVRSLVQSVESGKLTTDQAMTRLKEMTADG